MADHNTEMQEAIHRAIREHAEEAIRDTQEDEARWGTPIDRDTAARMAWPAVVSGLAAIATHEMGIDIDHRSIDAIFETAQTATDEE